MASPQAAIRRASPSNNTQTTSLTAAPVITRIRIFRAYVSSSQLRTGRRVGPFGCVPKPLLSRCSNACVLLDHVVGALLDYRLEEQWHLDAQANPLGLRLQTPRE